MQFDSLSSFPFSGTRCFQRYAKALRGAKALTNPHEVPPLNIVVAVDLVLSDKNTFNPQITQKHFLITLFEIHLKTLKVFSFKHSRKVGSMLRIHNWCKGGDPVLLLNLLYSE